MAKNKPKTILFRRKREKRTNYKKRLHLLLSQKPRLVLRFTNTKIIAQVAQFDAKGDKILAAVDSSGLRKVGWKYSTKNIPAAYLTGCLLAKKAKSLGEQDVVLDVGFKQPLHKGRAYAFLKGALDAGLHIAHGDEKIFPNDARLKGEHVSSYSQNAKEGQFSQYLKNNISPADMPAQFEEVKKKILA